MQESIPHHNTRLRLFVISLFTASFFFILAPAAHAAFNDSGQTLCYDDANTATDCTNAVTGDAASRPRQDARFGRDAAAAARVLTKTGDGDAGFDFTKISNAGGELSATAALGLDSDNWACTRDNVTGLMWEVKLDDATSPRHKDATYGQDGTQNGTCSLGAGNCNTSEYIATINATGLCGHSDWRLPSLRELLSIVHYGKSGLVIDDGWFPNTALAGYWSGDAAMLGFWYINFNGGATEYSQSAFRVRLVRGTPMPEADFQDNGDGTITDRSTGLMWMQCSQGQSGADCAAGTATKHEWADALAQATSVNAQSALGYNDWRLPNVKELHSLVDTNRSGPATDSTFFPNTSWDYYWSSTTYSTGQSHARIVDFYDGRISFSSKDKSSVVRLVRGGESFDILLPMTTTLEQTGISATEASFSATLSAQSDSADVTGYWLVRVATDPAPTPEELIAGEPCVAAGNSAIDAGQPQAFTAAELTSGTQYTLYYAVRDTSGNMSPISRLSFSDSTEAVPEILASEISDSETPEPQTPALATSVAATSIPVLNNAGLAALAAWMLAFGALFVRRRGSVLAARRHQAPYVSVK